MKKIKLSVAALLIASASYGQCCKVNDSLLVSKYRLYDMIATMDEMITWFGEDENNGDFSHGSIEEEWGHIYWISRMRDTLEDIVAEHDNRIRKSKKK